MDVPHHYVINADWNIRLMLKQVIENEPVELPVDEIDADSFVIRSDFGNLQELAESISSLGLLEPLIVREINNDRRKYQLLAGHRRLRACIMLNIKSVRALVVNVTDKDAYLIALSENVQRKSLNPIEEALAYANYVHKKGWGGLSELARNIGKSPTYIFMMMKLLDLPAEFREMVANGKVKPFVAAELTKVKDEGKMKELIERIKQEKPSMRRLRSLVNEGRISASSPPEAYLKALDVMIVSTRNAMINYDFSINKLGQGNEFYSRVLGFRYGLHQLLDQLINERAKIIRELKLSGYIA